MSRKPAYDPKQHMEKVLEELADLIKSEADAGRVGAKVVDKFNHLVNTWNIAQEELHANQRRGDYRPAPAASVEVHEKTVRVAGPDVNVNMPDVMVGVERAPLNVVRLSFGLINLNLIALLDVKSRQVYFFGMVRSLEREDVVTLVYWMKIYEAH